LRIWLARKCPWVDQCSKTVGSNCRWLWNFAASFIGYW